MLVIISALLVNSKSYLWPVFNRVGVIIKSVELYDLVKTVF